MQDLRVGRLVLNDAEVRDLESKLGSITIGGMQAGALVEAERIRRQSADIPNLTGQLVPVVFGSKEYRSGYYVVASADATLTDWPKEGVASAEWDIELALLGYSNDIDLESRLGGPLTLANSHSQVGSRWHSPAAGHYSYWTGAGSPSRVLRQGSEGFVPVYTDIPLDTNLLWGCAPENYGEGRVRFIDDLELERTGTSVRTDPASWSLDNSLVKVTPDSGTINVLRWDLGWQPTAFNLRYAGSTLGTPMAVSVVRNDYEMIQIRLLWNVTPSGRVTADLTLRRGARYVEVFMKAMTAATMAVVPTTPTASSSGSGFVAASSFFVGSPNAFTADTVAGGLSKAATASLDAVVGVLVGGDTANTVYKQFLGGPTERVIGVRL